MKKISIISLLPAIMLSFPVLAEEQSVRLSDTIVSTKGFSTKAQEETKNVSVITNEEIENKGYTDLSDVLANSPFVNIKSGEKGSDRQVDMRGQGKESASRVKVMVDDIPLNILDTSHSQSPLNSINPSQIEQIEIIPGGGSVLYGNNATGGTINIITKADNQKEYHYIEVLLKSYNTQDYSAGFGQNLTDNLYLHIDSAFVDGDGYRDKDNFHSSFVSGGLTYIVTENHKISANAKYSRDKGTTSDGISKEKIKEDRRQEGGFITDYKNTTTDYSLKYQGKFSDYYEVSAKGYYQELKTDNNGVGDIIILPNSEFGKWAGVWDGFMDGGFKETKTGANIKQKMSYEYGSLVTGYDFVHNKLDRNSLVHLDIAPNPYMPEGMNYNLLANNSLSKDTHSVFGIVDHKVVGDLRFNAGYRFEYSKFDLDRGSQVAGTHETPPSYFKDNSSNNNQAYNVGLSYDLDSLNKVYISYERGFVSASPTQLVDKDPINGYVLNDLKSQTGDNYEIGYKGYVLNSYFSLTGFYSENKNEIVLTDMNPSHTEWHYKNLEKTRRTGLEGFAEQNVGRFTLSEGATFINTKILKGEYKDQKIATVPDFKMVLSGKYEVVDAFNIGARVNYTSNYLENNYDNTTIKKSTAPTVVTADLFLDYKPIDRMYVLAGINNVLNRKYNISQDTYGNYIVAPDRNFYVGLKYEV